jgi:anti-sigma28 factor (negative regulator of flagellin synthesis)
MRVDEHTLNDSVSSTASRAAESQRIQVDTSASSGAAGATSSDRVDLSGLAGRITQSLESLAQHSTQRVNQLQKEFQAGRYQPGAQQLSRALLGS